MFDRKWVRVDSGAALAALDYPGTPVSVGGLLDGDRFWPGRRPESVDDRRLVLAVGSNADPAVLAGKLRRAGATGVVPMVLARAPGLAVGHSAHVSAGGYLPAAPYVSASSTPAVGLWLTLEQCAAIDVTEPNYQRMRLPTSRWPIVINMGSSPDAVDVYASRWGVLAPGGSPLALGRQVALHARLAGLAGIAELAPWQDAAAAVGVLAADPELRSRVRQGLADAGWVVDSGLAIGA